MLPMLPPTVFYRLISVERAINPHEGIIARYGPASHRATMAGYGHLEMIRIPQSRPCVFLSKS